mgnify:FL=1
MALIDGNDLIDLNLELAIQPTLNANLMPRNPNDASQPGGQSSSSSSGEQQGQQAQQATQPTDITVAVAPDSTVKAATDPQATQVTASSMG